MVSVKLTVVICSYYWIFWLFQKGFKEWLQLEVFRNLGIWRRTLMEFSKILLKFEKWCINIYTLLKPFSHCLSLFIPFHTSEVYKFDRSLNFFEWCHFNSLKMKRYWIMWTARWAIFFCSPCLSLFKCLFNQIKYHFLCVYLFFFKENILLVTMQ